MKFVLFITCMNVGVGRAKPDPEADRMANSQLPSECADPDRGPTFPSLMLLP